MYDEFLKQAYPNQHSSMAYHQLGEERVWLKRAVKRNGRFTYTPLNLFALVLKVQALKPVPNPGGEKSIQTEVARLEALDAAGIAVPRLLACNSQALLLADAGTPEAPASTLLHCLKRAESPEEVDRLLQLGIEALNDVHRRGFYLSEAFTRNILVVNGRQIVFIDFETDPGEIHTPLDCMVRDWYCFIFSLYGKLHASPLQRERLTPAFIEGLNRTRGDVSTAFKQALSPLLRLQRIPFKRFGSDGRKIHSTLQSLAILQKRIA
ncbi:hypothetical protein ACGLWX_10240 [Halomonas sp. HMF6819]|uniref:hypothetical protein n=1 Tax=Halomonas sp. HMF6819 TaxID=3373085 RepID=UPI0037A28860